MSLKNRSFLKLLDYTPAEIEQLLDLAADLKAKKKAGIAEVVYYSDKYHDTDSSVAARFMFKKAGVRLTPYQPSGRKMELEL